MSGQSVFVSLVGSIGGWLRRALSDEIGCCEISVIHFRLSQSVPIKNAVLVLTELKRGLDYIINSFKLV